MDKKDEVLDYLYREHKNVLDQVAKFEDRIDNIIVSSVLIIGTITALISNKDEENLLKNITIAIPIAAIVVLSVYCISYFKLMRCGGYKKYIEERIVEIIGPNETGWEAFVSEKSKRFDFLSISIYSVYIFVLLALSGISLYNVYNHLLLVFYIETSLLLIIIVIFLLTLLKIGFKTYSETYLYFKGRNSNQDIVAESINKEVVEKIVKEI